MMNPRLRCAVRRRHSTVIVLEEYGHQIELIFTSLGALEALADDAQGAVDLVLEQGPGSEWWNPKVPQHRRRGPDLDLLHEEQLLETPEFLRRRTVAVRRVTPPAKPPAAGG